MVKLDTPDSPERQAEDTGKRQTQPRTAVLIVGLVILVAAIVIAIAVLTSGGSGAPAEKTVLVDPSAKPPLYHQTRYDVETGWVPEMSDRRVGAYLESGWHDPASFSSKLFIDSRPSAGTIPPLAAAELARVQTNRLPGYRERSLKRIDLGNHPAVRWAFFVAGEDRIEYFFEECGTSIVFRGSTTPIAFKPFSEFYGIVASRIKVRCDK
jgi:hypothetical protein